MPRYFFHIDDGELIPDDVGAEFPSQAAARSEAVKISGEMLTDFDGELWTAQRIGEWPSQTKMGIFASH